MSLWTNVDNENGKPKYLSTADKAICNGVSVEEAGVTANKNKGVVHSGWSLYSTYTDSSGATRHKSECLVAMGSMLQAGGDLNADDTKLGVDPA